ncbi:MAG: response regulator [Pirellulales bacterium]|nr:response regulator [Pirellulales bacterium]
MDAERSVLVIDRSEDTREVLKTALERSGLRVYAASRGRRGAEMAHTHHPDLIVLDLEVDDSPPEVLEALADQATQGETALVMIGSLGCRTPFLPPGEFVSKPYHYGPLIRRIEELLSATGQAVSRGTQGRR